MYQLLLQHAIYLGDNDDSDEDDDEHAVKDACSVSWLGAVGSIIGSRWELHVRDDDGAAMDE